MHPKAILSKLALRLLDHLFGIIFGILVVAGLAAWGAFFADSAKRTLNYAIAILNIHTPLWATIALLLLCGLYIRLKATKHYQKNDPLCQPKEELISVGEFKWKVRHAKGQVLEVGGLPYCIEHECSLIPRNSHWICPIPDCKSILKKYDLDKARVAASSIIENLIRHRPNQAVQRIANKSGSR